MARTEIPEIIVESIAIEASPTAVFAALTEPDQLVRWWGSDDAYRCHAMERDLRVGGAWKTSGTGSDGEPFSVSGVYRVVEPPHALEFTWCHDWGGGDGTRDATPGDTIVRYDLEARDGVTHVRVTHSGFTSVEDRDNHARGWTTVLGWLHRYFAR